MWGCQTTPPKNFSVETQGTWSAKIQVQTPRRPAFPLAAKIKADGLEKLRMDLTTLSGFYVGSVVVLDDNFKALIAREKKFYQGRSNPEVMKKTLQVPLDPRWINRILFELPADEWTCQKDARGFLKECSEQKANLKITWNERTKDQRSVSIFVRDVKADIYLRHYEAVIAKPEKAFSLKTPQSFKVIQL